MYLETTTLTCVYMINDEEGFKLERSRLMEMFKQFENRPWSITAMSVGHEIRRLELVEEAHRENRHDLLDSILELVDPTKVVSLRQLPNYLEEKTVKGTLPQKKMVFIGFLETLRRLL